jgi:hypothetical protein
VRFALRRDSRTTNDAPAPDAPRPEGRPRSRSSRLAAAGVALFALAAAPVGAAAADGLPEPVADAVSTTLAGLASMTAEATGASASNGFADPEDRAVRTAVAAPMTPAEQTSFTPAPEPDDESAEEADEESGQQEAQQEPETDSEQDASAERSVWDRLAECESGEWVNGGESFVEGSARWDYGLEFAHEGYEQFQGGLNFHPGTWDAYRDPDMPDHAGHASREQEIVVAERVLASQGWQAWPRCAQMLGLR